MPSPPQYRALLDAIADELCRAVDGNFDFRIDGDYDDETIQKFIMMLNYLLDAVGRALSEVEEKARAIEANLAALTRVNGELQNEIEEHDRAERRFRALTENSPDPIIIVDQDGRIIYANPKVSTFFGYSEDELLGNLVEMLIPERFQAIHPSQRQDFFENSRTRPMGADLELVALRRGGEEVPVEVSLGPFEFDGEMVVAATVIDLTARKQVEKERAHRVALEREASQLHEALAAQDQFIAVMSHELRTPLAAIRASSEVLLDDLEEGSPTGRKLVGSIHRSVDRLSSMVSDMLETARLQSGQAQWNWTIVDLEDVMSDVIEEISPLFQGSAVTLDWKLVSDELSMRGDGGAIHRLLINLLSNARRHTTEGVVSLTIRAVIDRGNSFIEFVVEDTGEGIRSELAGRLGTPFALNAGINGAKHVSGTGLGLGICKLIASGHRGSMAIQSTLGEGTKVTVRLRTDLAAPESVDRECSIDLEVGA